MAGYTAANNILGFLYASINAVTQACMSFTSQNYGVNKPKRMDRVMIDCIILSVGVSLVLGCGSYAFGGEILKIYTEDPEVIRCGLEILALTTVTYFLCGVMDLFPGALRGMGASAVPMILSIIGTVGTRIVWIFPGSSFLKDFICVVSGVLDIDDFDAGSLLLFCKKKGTSGIKTTKLNR